MHAKPSPRGMSFLLPSQSQMRGEKRAWLLCKHGVIWKIESYSMEPALGKAEWEVH